MARRFYSNYETMGRGEDVLGEAMSEQERILKLEIALQELLEFTSKLYLSRGFASILLELPATKDLIERSRQTLRGQP